MTNKIPVGATIARAYSFAFTNIVNNLGAIWMQALILWICSYFFFAPYRGAAAQLATGNPQMIARAFPFFLAAFVLMFVLVAGQIAAVTKEALGLRTGNAFLQFPFGGPMWRLLASYVLFVLAMIAIYIVILVATLIGGVVLGLLARVLAGPIITAIVALCAVLGLIAVFCAIIYIAVRLSFFLAPVAVAERHISLIRGWMLTKGNFWRIFVVILSIVIPLLFVEFTYIYAIYGGSLIPPLGSPITPQNLAQWQQHEQQLMLAATARMQHYWYLYYPLGLLFALIFYALFAGVSAFAYRAVVVPETPEATA